MLEIDETCNSDMDGILHCQVSKFIQEQLIMFNPSSNEILIDEALQAFSSDASFK
jgi:hypothetical protein